MHHDIACLLIFTEDDPEELADHFLKIRRAM